MSRTWRLLLSGVLMAGPLAAQRSRDPDPPATALLARAESLSNLLTTHERRASAEVKTFRRGQVLSSGRLIVVLWNGVTPSVGQRLAAMVDSTVQAFGGGPAELLGEIVAVQLNTSDTAVTMRRPDLARRRRVVLDWVEIGEPATGAFRLVDHIGRMYRSTLDSLWQVWLPDDFGIAWDPKVSSDWALSALLEPDVAVGSDCLGGSLAGCRLWLGLDDDPRPIALRYRPPEIRRRLYAGAFRGTPDRQKCAAGDDAACYRYAEAVPVVSPIPATSISRASFVRAVWALHGQQAVARAFADRHGAIGERFARAVNLREDSLVAEWRTWTLGRGRTERLAAGLPMSLVILASASLAVWAAARSGRWR